MEDHLEVQVVNLDLLTYAGNSDNPYSREYRSGVKFLQVSTDEVYGALGAEGMFTESTPLAPNSPYSASKAAVDLLVLVYYKTYGLPVYGDGIQVRDWLKRLEERGGL